jgi:hypothetical protein
MKVLRNLVSALAVALAVCVCVSSSAQAQVELLQEDGDHCSSFTMAFHEAVGATCSWELDGVLNVYIHSGAAEIQVASCSSRMEAAFNETGSGYLYNPRFSPEGGICGREPCDELGHTDLAWPAQISEPVVGLDMAVTMCFAAHSSDPVTEGKPELQFQCSISLNVTGSFTHDFALSTPPASGGNGGAPCNNLGGVVEVVGSLVSLLSVSHPNDIEVVH